MIGRRLLVPVYLDQHDVRGICLVLHDIEAQHPRLGQRCPRIDLRGGQEIRHSIWSDVNVNVNDQHAHHPDPTARGWPATMTVPSEV